MTDDRPPAELRAKIARTIAPVSPLRPPWHRALAFLALGTIWLVLVPIAWGVREDATVLGFSRLWLLSVLQVVVAGLVFRQVLAESIPGRLSAPRRLVVWAGIGALFMLVVTLLTFATSQTHVPPLRETRYLYTCTTRTVAIGLPALVLAGWLLHRGLTVRPVIAGALAGLGAGLLADSSWRLYCEVSDPWHVLTAHAGGVVTLAAVGALLGLLSRVVTFTSHDPR